MIICPTCKNEYDTEPKTCSECNFPFEGTEKERNLFIGKQISKKNKFSETNDKIKRARIIIWIIGVITIGQYFISLTSEIDLLIGILFVGFGFLTYSKPFIAILIPFILLILTYTFSAFIDLGLLLQGILFKIIFLFGLGYGLIMIIQTNNLKKESNFLKNQKFE